MNVLAKPTASQSLNAALLIRLMLGSVFLSERQHKCSHDVHCRASSKAYALA